MGILRALFGGYRAPMSNEPDGHQVEWDDIPAGIRARIGTSLPPGHIVWRCPCHDARGGVLIEWWWHDERGELVDVFWVE
jgi:hypothetical protein